jgi:hypothetical protein
MISNSNPSANKFEPRITLITKIRMPDAMSRVDLLCPILKLECALEDFVLDLHYSVNKFRTGDAKIVSKSAAVIAELLKANSQLIISELEQRVPGLDPMWFLQSWVDGFEKLALVAGLADEIEWKRSL